MQTNYQYLPPAASPETVPINIQQQPQSKTPAISAPIALAPPTSDLTPESSPIPITQDRSSLDRPSSPSPTQLALQVNPTPIAQGIPRDLDRTPKSKPPELLTPKPDPLTPPPPVPPPAAPSAPTKINVLRYEVIGSTVFSTAELTQLTQPFTGEVSFTRIQEAAQEVQKLYIDRRYLTSGAYIPSGQELNINSAVVQIKVLEGKLEDIKVTGNRRLNPGYIKSRIARTTQAPLNYDHLVESVRLLQQTPLLKQVNVELSSGAQPGTNLLEINIKEAQPLNLTLLSDNNRSPSAGSVQGRIQAGHANLMGLGDSLSIGYGSTRGSSALDINYSIPLNPTDTTLSFTYGKTHSKVIEQPFNSLDIISDSKFYEATLRQPLFRSAKANQTQELAIGLTGSRIESDTTLLDIPFKLSEGADPNGHAKITALRFFQEYLTRNNNEVLSLRSQVNLGLDALDSTINNEGADSRFFHWQGQARWFRQLKEDLNLVFQAKAQLADRPLPSLEQFSIGGANTVRGYRQDVRVADNGFFSSLELQAPLWRSKSRKSVLQVAPFVDVGTVWSRDPFTTIENRTLASTGVGLIWRSPKWSARLDWGVPLIEIDSRKNSLQENGLYFSIRYAPI